MMNKAKEPKISRLEPMGNIKPIPINKKCSVCKQLKLLSEYTFDMSLKTKDHRARVCNSCLEKREEEDCHTEDCINGKFMDAVYAQLETLLAISENGVLIPDEILGLMCDIIDRDERNMEKD
jgi:hypothetical protein